MEDNKNTHQGWSIKDLWTEYENVAMHFNDLLLKLRIQALGAVTAISAVVGLFSKADPNPAFSWQIATAIFIALLIFWCAIWLIDSFYYNRLLRGATTAIMLLEKESVNDEQYTNKIDLSTKIHEAVEAKGVKYETGSHRSLWKHPITYFYLIVLCTLVFAICFSYNNYQQAKHPIAHFPAGAVT